MSLYFVWALLLPILLLSFTQRVQAEAGITINSPKEGEALTEDVVRVTGSYQEVNDIHLLIDAKEKVPVKTDTANNDQGTWYYDLDTSEYSGEIELVATGSNAVNRYTVWSNKVVATVQNPKANIPVVTIVSPVDGEQIDKNNVKMEIDVEATNHIQAVEVRINGSQWIDAKSKKGSYEFKWKIKHNKMEDQTVSIEARAKDKYGNTGYSSTTYADIGNGFNEETQFVKQDRAMWIWENASYNLLYNEGSRNTLDAMAKDTTTFQQEEITTLYFGVDEYFGVDMLEDERKKVRDFVSWAHDNGYKVHALIAGGTRPPYFGAYEQHHDKAIREFENILNYNLSSDRTEQFDGVNIDIEPYIAPDFKTDKPSLQLQYLDLLQIFMDRKEAAGSGIYVGAAIPRWYDSSPYAENITWGPEGEPKETKWLSQHVQDILDYISIMDYRDQADGSAGIIAQAQGEIDYAKQIGKPNSVVIGVETKDIADGGDPEVISFREEGRTYMEEELDKVENAFVDDSSYGGIALHHYDTIRYLPTEWSPDAVYWQPPMDEKAPTGISKKLTAHSFNYQTIYLTYGRAFDNQEIEGYNIYRSTEKDFEADESTFVGHSRRLDYSDQGLLPKTTYYYQVAPVDVSGNIGEVSTVASATTANTTLKPLIINEASISYDGTKGNVSIKVVDKETNEGLSTSLGGRFTKLSGKYINTSTNEKGITTFSSENLSNEKGQLGFKVNSINAAGYYWASAYDSYATLETEWSKQVIQVLEDAHVRSGSYQNENYGSSPLLEIKDVEDSKSTQYDRLSYVKYDLSTVKTSSVQRALLHIYVDRTVTDSTVSNVPITISGVDNDNWTEEDITYADKPDGEGDTIIGNIHVTSKGWYSIDVTPFVREQLQDKIVTIKLSDTTGTDRSVKVHSKENQSSSFLEIQ
ncbi:DNRLRE domain-containing protein [Pontibacillus salicampi]|uniref:DNRLRE domain-containing protein n=1 Tax=Pontibacillus salicampi TaxID=1449801 RepID=A0ABV6LR48_9BACI